MATVKTCRLLVSRQEPVSALLCFGRLARKRAGRGESEKSRRFLSLRQSKMSALQRSKKMLTNRKRTIAFHD